MSTLKRSPGATTWQPGAEVAASRPHWLGEKFSIRRFVGAIGLAVVLVELRGNAQTRPDFSGTWIPAESTSVTACNGSLTVTQDTATMRVALTAPSARHVYKVPLSKCVTSLVRSPLS